MAQLRLVSHGCRSSVEVDKAKVLLDARLVDIAYRHYGPPYSSQCREPTIGRIAPQRELLRWLDADRWDVLAAEAPADEAVPDSALESGADSEEVDLLDKLDPAGR